MWTPKIVYAMVSSIATFVIAAFLLISSHGDTGSILAAVGMLNQVASTGAAVFADPPTPRP